MRVAFYAPLKPPDHAVPSGDRRLARLLMDALTRAGHEVELASVFRSFEDAGDRSRQRALQAEGEATAGALIARFRERPPAERPAAWLTYHLYHKAPDWLGPAVCDALALPYIVAEASYAPKQASGPWAAGHAAVGAALRRADGILTLNPDDRACLEPLAKSGAALTSLPPFLELQPYRDARDRRGPHRASLAARFGLEPALPWLLTVAMMRPGDKLASYGLLGEALDRLSDSAWQLLVVGDGPARAEVEAALSPAGDRTRFAGAIADENLPPVYAAADLFVWPAVREAFGMAILEAQAAGLPVVAGYTPGVAEIVVDGETGRLTAATDAGALGAAIGDLLGDPGRRRAMAARAAAKCAAEHDLAAAARRLDGILHGAVERYAA